MKRNDLQPISCSQFQGQRERSGDKSLVEVEELCRSGQIETEPSQRHPCVPAAVTRSLFTFCHHFRSSLFVVSFLFICGVRMQNNTTGGTVVTASLPRRLFYPACRACSFSSLPLTWCCVPTCTHPIDLSPYYLQVLLSLSPHIHIIKSRPTAQPLSQQPSTATTLLANHTPTRSFHSSTGPPSPALFIYIYKQTTKPPPFPPCSPDSPSSFPSSLSSSKPSPSLPPLKVKTGVLRELRPSHGVRSSRILRRLPSCSSMT
jgi:hypothetical protein